MKVALVHDYLKEYGGAERVLSVLHEMFPEAPIYTLFFESGSPAGENFKKVKKIQSWFSFVPLHAWLISPLRFLIPLMWMGFNFDKYDLIISSSSWAITKGFSNGKNREICYCHTPPRYLYGYETSRNWKKHWYIRFYATVVNHFMRLYDFKRAQKVTQFVANSREVQKRIEKFYRRESVIVSPPVDVEGVKGYEGVREKYFITGGRLEAAKRFDLIIKACNKLKVPLKIFGRGSQEESLKKIAGGNVEFLGPVSDEEKFRLIGGAKAFIVAGQDEDFGITPVEAMAAGTPVVAYKSGGYLESVVDGKTGVFFEEYTSDSLGEATKRVLKMKFKKDNLQKQAEKFSKEIFIKKMKEVIDA